MYDYIFFDLDGTLIDPKEGITKSVAYSLNKFGIKISNLDDLTVFIGPPLIDSYMINYNFSKKQALQATMFYRERFKEFGLTECMLYDGVIELLTELKKLGKRIVLATSKPELFAEQILKNLKIDSYFDLITGATFDESRSKKSDVIKYAIDKLMINESKKVVMVGDRKYDIEGAKINQIASIGVLYGYGSTEELEKANADYLVTSLTEILAIVK